MKVKNKEIGIKIGKKELKFTNMILDTYLDLFADSFISFESKDLTYCLVNFTHINNINETSKEMEYDLVLEADFNKNIEILSPTSITNKYFYKNPIAGQDWNNYKGYRIQNIGFARLNSQGNGYSLYAYLDVSNYNIIVQDEQPIIISRIDQITSDMDLWVNNSEIKAPYHLTMRGMLNLKGYEYESITPKLYSVGFGVLPYTLNKEYLASSLDIIKDGAGKIKINDTLEAQYNPNTKFFNNNIYFNNDWYFENPTYDYMIYKFVLYRETYPNPEEEPVWVNTGLFYTQYKKDQKNGKINLSIKYERS